MIGIFLENGEFSSGRTMPALSGRDWAIGRDLLSRQALLVLAIGAMAIAFGALFTWWHIGDMYYRRSLVAFRLFCAENSGQAGR